MRLPRTARPMHLAIACLAALPAVAPAFAAGEVVKSEEHSFRLEIVVRGLEHPWALAFLPTGDVLVTERPGRLRQVQDGRLAEAPLRGVPEVAAIGQGGLLDVALHPRFADNRLVYLSYSKPGPDGATTALARGRLEADALTEVADIFVADARGSGGNHFGSRIAFDRDGLLYLTIGERNEQDPAQDLGNHKGTVVRLTDDGKPAPGNPFAGRAGAAPEIFTYGHRNAQGMALHPETGAVWIHEHGPRGGDEINLLNAGANYGWPVITYGRAYSGLSMGEGTHKPGMEQPLLQWTPSIAPSGMAFYRGDAFPRWRGNLFVGALAHRHLQRLVFDGITPVHQEKLLTEFGQRIRDVRQGPDGFLYILTDASDGVLARLVPAE